MWKAGGEEGGQCHSAEKWRGREELGQRDILMLVVRKQKESHERRPGPGKGRMVAQRRKP